MRALCERGPFPMLAQGRRGQDGPPGPYIYHPYEEMRIPSRDTCSLARGLWVNPKGFLVFV